MIDDNEDAFESAAAAAGEELEPTVPIEATEVDEDAEIEIPVRRPRGRPRGRRSRSRRARSHRASEGEARPARTQPAPEIQTPPAIPPLPPEKLIPLLRQLDKTFTRLVGTAPLDEQELKDGAEACAPVLDHYAPLFLSQPWAPAAIWAGMVYVPRVVEVYDRRKAGGGRPPARFPVSTNGAANEDSTPETVVA
jgi:hypothetical protein